MAEASISVAQDQFSCPVCLDLLKDPVTIPCGHSYCMRCITDCWNQEDLTGVYSCPQCRQTFTPRPALSKNVVFADMLEKLKQTEVSAQCFAGPGDVECDVCTGRKRKAMKSCLVCLSSYCPGHLQQHETFFKGKKQHKLMDATRRLQEAMCRKHDKHLDIYCRTDQQCICYLCVIEKHKNHDTVTAAEERTEKQEQLSKKQKDLLRRIQQKVQEIQKLRETIESHKLSAQTAVEDSGKIFTELILYIERRRSEFTQLIRGQEKAAVSRAEGLLKRLEQEVDEMKRRDSEMKQLLQTDDHIYFLQSFRCLSASPEATDVPNTLCSAFTFEDVTKSLSLLKEKLKDSCDQEMEMVSGEVTYIQIIPTPDPKTREDFLQYSRQLTLDPNTANKRLRLSEGNKQAFDSGSVQPYPDHPDRFDQHLQLLSRESVCGRCYWELDWSGSGGLAVSVAYKSIRRKGEGDECVFGFNRQSWSLFYRLSGSLFFHDKKQIKLHAPLSCCRLGVYVDHRAGTLSFYSVSDTSMSLIHTEQTTFTQPLYPGFLLAFGSTIKLL
ncbi:finTRIM family, member 64 [Danio rerio]|uniref:FinTRIM family, member 64 n=1 Tax=Danio rerio TaxID=7955 RepID=A0A0R4INJ4_DANRE|nr:finTRIM family, member 64 [Danio rerio]|eukprot:NP_001314743.1 finTRIM family, member 64 [Danio rerio]